MQTNQLRPLLHKRFRANSGYQLILFDHLPQHLQDQLAHLTADETFYGVLWSEKDRGAIKAVDQATALLYFTLMEPAEIPSYIRLQFGNRADTAISQLVLDHVLEIETEADQFIGGVSAHPHLYQEIINPHTADGAHVLAKLSQQAVHYGQHLDRSHVEQIAYYMYTYNTSPVTNCWRERLSDTADINHWLGLSSGSEINRLVSRHWKVSQQTDHWITFHNRNSASQTTLPYKLYISPQIEALPDTFASTLVCLGELAVPSFKVGGQLLSLLRPDKLIVYLPDFVSLSHVAEKLQQILSDVPAQGVPFTAPIDASGLLSWGMDPPSDYLSVTNASRQSWRSWIVSQLAKYLVEGRKQANIPPWQYALDRLQLEGVDTTTWVPQQAVWLT